MQVAGRATCFTLVSCLPFSPTMNMEVECFSKMLVAYQQTTMHSRTLLYINFVLYLGNKFNLIAISEFHKMVLTSKTVITS
jgi:hypothetical protein